MSEQTKTQYGVLVVWADPVEAGACKRGEAYIPEWQHFDTERQADNFVAYYRFPAPDGSMFQRSEVAEVKRATRWAIERYGAWEEVSA